MLPQWGTKEHCFLLQNCGNPSLAEADNAKMYAEILSNTIMAYAMSNGWYARVLKK
jgi:hypothetical protein